MTSDNRLDSSEWIHLVKVGATRPEWDDMIDVWLPNDPKYAHVALTRVEYLYYAETGDIEMDAESGYPMYIGDERLRGEWSSGAAGTPTIPYMQTLIAIRTSVNSNEIHGRIAVLHLKAWRLSKDQMTQTELSERSGVDRKTIISLEGGSMAYGQTVKRLARALNITPQQLAFSDPYEGK
jgi:DNA-binding XRE family transcriptional regulator